MVVQLEVVVQSRFQVGLAIEAGLLQKLVDAAVEAFNHAVCLRVARWREAVFNTHALADLVEYVLAAGLLVFAGEAVRELRAIVGQDFDDLDRRGILQAAQEIDAAGVTHVVVDVQEHPARGAVNGHEQITARRFIRHVWTADQVKVETERPDGSRQTFTFVQRDGYVESMQEIPEPHEFVARLRLGHDHHSHDYDVEFVEHDHHHHAIKDYEGLDVSAPGYQDPHELAHANDIRRRFAGREVTTGQIIVFGLTGGLIPCPASITVLLLCLQLKRIALGATLVMCFSIGLALTMVASGALAALSVKHVSKRWSGFGDFARNAPYFSGALIVMVGLYVGYQGLRVLMA